MRLFGYQRGGRWQGTRANIVMIASYADPAAGTGIDIGSNEGLNAFALALCGLKVRAVEGREKNHRRAVALSRRLEADVVCENAYMTEDRIAGMEEVGVTIFMSVHHQLAMNWGLERANAALQTLAGKTRSQMFFQPACIAGKYGTDMPFADNDYAAVAQYFQDIIGGELPHCAVVGFAQNDHPKSEPMRPMMVFGREPVKLREGPVAVDVLERITQAL